MPPSPSTLVELRRYRLRPRRGPELLALFDEHFAREHARLGIALLGPFLDADDPDALVWLRAFPSLEERRRSLGAFYDGPVWCEHRDRANATMVDSSNAALLEPVTPDLDPAAAVAPVRRPARPAILVLVHPAGGPDGAGAPSDRPHPPDALLARLDAAGVPVHRAFTTSPAPNTFPRLPLVDHRVTALLLGLPEPAWCDRAGTTDRLRRCVAAAGTRRPARVEYLRLTRPGPIA